MKNSMRTCKISSFSIIVLLFILASNAQEKTISRDSLDTLIEATFEYAYAYDYEKAIATSAFVVNEALKNEDYVLASEGSLRVGSIYMRMKDSSNSLSYYKKSLEYAKRSKVDSIIANVYNDIGNLYMESGGNLDEARKNFEKSLEIWVYSGGNEKSTLAPYMNAAWVYIALEEPKKALPFLNKSKKIIDRNPNVPPLYSINLDVLRGQYHIQRANYTRAISILKDASIRSVDGNFLKQSAETQHFLAAAYEKNGDGEAAIRSLKKNI
ncbi:MAG: tetratricopeptide (TPR) repeat protein, partial [Patiriisocius sp.]